MRTSSVRIVRLNKLCADVAFLQQVRMSGYFILFQLWKLASLTPLAIGYLCSSGTKKNSACHLYELSHRSRLI